MMLGAGASYHFHSLLCTKYTECRTNFYSRPNDDRKKGTRRPPSSPTCFSKDISNIEMGSSEISSSASEVNKEDLPLPAAFLEFLEENGLDPSIYSLASSIPRYIRIKPGFESEISEIELELKCELEKVSWLPGFYSVPSQIQIASSNAYQLGKIYGVDAASGAAVKALNVSQGDHILDLCAAPGAKLCMLSEFLGGTGSLTGVDVARHRLAACRTMLRKYSLGDTCRLFVADGTTFSLLPIKSLSDGETDTVASEEKFVEWTGRKTRRDKKREFRARQNNLNLNLISEPELIYYGKNSGIVGLNKSDLFRPLSNDDDDASSSGYDKVLVDAECTHDGSIKHIQKFENWGWKTLQRRVLDAERTDDLFNLQLQLLTNGFKLLKSGGILVYSTCSFTVGQNEDMVGRFLALNPLAELREIEEAQIWPCKPGKLPKTLRFDPAISQTSGLFIAKLSKLA